MKEEIRKLLGEFVSSENPESLVTVGWEIETQLTRDGEREFDRDAAYQSIDDETICSYAGLQWRSDWVDRLNNIHDSLADALGVELSDIVDDMENDEDSCFWSEEEVSIDPDDYCPDGVEHCDDCSVSGPEFTVAGEGTDWENAIGLACQLFNNFGDDLKCDIECSCHIHLQVAGVRHIGCDSLRQLLFWEVMERFDQLPQQVQKRIRACNKFYAPQANHDGKYNPIRCHPDYHTWEFRLFGNCQDVLHVKECMRVALEAMQSAYAQFLSGDYRHDIVDAVDFVPKATAAMKGVAQCV